MADHLGPGGYNSNQLAIDVMILELNDIQYERTELSEAKQLMHKHASYEVAEIEARYNPEIQYIRNEMRNQGDLTNSEYFELMADLEELETMRDNAKTVVEKEENDKESEYEQQDTMLENMFNQLTGDKEGLENANDENIKR
ncbi:MAG: hypothetical protein IJ877_04205 [Candidatus Gastranaerophilales bacterium]|nr:hypothetical protein [Candidatus Gastranaerophilales bacterium]